MDDHGPPRQHQPTGTRGLGPGRRPQAAGLRPADHRCGWWTRGRRQAGPLSSGVMAAPASARSEALALRDPRHLVRSHDVSAGTSVPRWPATLDLQSDGAHAAADAITVAHLGYGSLTPALQHSPRPADAACWLTSSRKEPASSTPSAGTRPLRQHRGGRDRLQRPGQWRNWAQQHRAGHQRHRQWGRGDQGVDLRRRGRCWRRAWAPKALSRPSWRPVSRRHAVRSWPPPTGFSRRDPPSTAAASASPYEALQLCAESGVLHGASS